MSRAGGFVAAAEGGAERDEGNGDAPREGVDDAAVTEAAASVTATGLHFGLVVEEVALPLAGLPAAFEGYRIALLSDLHVFPYTPRRLLEQAVRVVSERAPDLVVMPGDFVSYSARRLERYRELLGRLQAPDGVLATLGNHDHKVGAGKVRRTLEGAGVRVLHNESVGLERGGAHLAVAGLDDVLEGEPDLTAALREVDESGPALLLVHEPDLAPENLRDPRVGLQLSGHSHGGQIRIPFVAGAAGAPRLPKLGRRYPAGRYDLPGGTLYTTRGVGVIGLPLRFACPPEVTLVRLIGASDDDARTRPEADIPP